MLVITVAVILSKYFDGVQCDIGTSTYEMIDLLRSEIDLVKTLVEKGDEFKDVLDKVYPLDGDGYRIPRLYSSDSLEKYVGNPINSLILMKRTAMDLMAVQEKLLPLKNMTKDFPTKHQFNAACESFILLQRTYDLHTSDLARGLIHGNILDNTGIRSPAFSTNYSLDWMVMRQLGITSKNRNWLDLAVEWMELSKTACQESHSCKDLQVIERDLRNIIATHDKFLIKKGPIGDKHRTLLHPRKAKISKKVKQSSNITANYLPLFQAMTIKESVPNFDFICKNGPVWRSPKDQARVRCKYVDHGLSYLKLGPFKAEELSDSPLVIQFKDFLTGEECEKVKDKAKNNMERSLVGSVVKDKKKTKGSSRTSKQAWLQDILYRFPVTESYKGLHGDGRFILDFRMRDEDIPSLAGIGAKKHLVSKDDDLYSITVRIGLATKTTLGLPLSGESYQVANYGIGGQYKPHLDPSGYFQSPETLIRESLPFFRATGDRLATFMAYLEDVEVGGGTAFPVLGIRSEVEKGTGVFWPNLIGSGYVDLFTIHGGCPVLVGSKWIMNKWIQYNDQGLRNYPCSIEFSTRFK